MNRTTTLLPTKKHYYLVTMDKLKIEHIDHFNRRGGRVIDRLNTGMTHRLASVSETAKMYVMASDDRLDDDQVADKVFTDSTQIYG